MYLQYYKNNNKSTVQNVNMQQSEPVIKQDEQKLFNQNVEKYLNDDPNTPLSGPGSMVENTKANSTILDEF
jgi:hypothetical protein